jgi:hypothetical protein
MGQPCEFQVLSGRARAGTGALLFIIYILLGVFVLLNMFIAILTEAYDKAKVRVFGDSEYEQEAKYHHAINMIPYVTNHVKAATALVPRVFNFAKDAASKVGVRGGGEVFSMRMKQQFRQLAANARSRVQRHKRDSGRGPPAGVGDSLCGRMDPEDSRGAR